MDELRNYIGGAWVTSSSSKFLDVKNPATDETIVKVPLSTMEEVEKAVDTAQHAFHKWRKIPALQRVRYLFKLKMLLEANQNKIAELSTNPTDNMLELQKLANERTKLLEQCQKYENEWLAAH